MQCDGYRCKSESNQLGYSSGRKSLKEIVQVFLKSDPLYEEPGKLSFQTLVKVLNACHLPRKLRNTVIRVFQNCKSLNPIWGGPFDRF